MSVDFVRDLEISLNNATVLLERTKQRTRKSPITNIRVEDPPGQDQIRNKREKRNLKEIENTNFNQLLEITRISESLHKLQSRIIKQHSLLLKEQSQSLQYQNIIQLDNLNELQKRQTMHQMNNYQHMIKMNNNLASIPIQRPIVVEKASYKDAFVKQKYSADKVVDAVKSAHAEATSLNPDDLISKQGLSSLSDPIQPQEPAVLDPEIAKTAVPIQNEPVGTKESTAHKLELNEIKDKVQFLISLVQKENEKQLDSFDYSLIKNVVHSEQINMELKKIDELIENIPKKNSRLPKWSVPKSKAGVTPRATPKVNVASPKITSTKFTAQKKPIVTSAPTPKKSVMSPVKQPIVISKDPIFLRKTSIRPKSLEFLKSNPVILKKPFIQETRDISTSPIENEPIATESKAKATPIQVAVKETRDSGTSTLPEPIPPSKTESTQISPLFHQSKSVQFQSPTKDASIQHDYSPPPVFELRKPVKEQNAFEIPNIPAPVFEKSLQDRLAEWIKSEVLLKVIKETESVPLVTVKPPAQIEKTVDLQEKEEIVKDAKPVLDIKEPEIVEQETQPQPVDLKEKVVKEVKFKETFFPAVDEPVKQVEIVSPEIKPENVIENYLEDSFNSVSTPYTHKSYDLSEYDPIVNEDEPSHLMDSTIDEYSLDIISSVIKEVKVQILPPKEIGIQTSEMEKTESTSASSLSSAYPLPDPPKEKAVPTLPDSIIHQSIDQLISDELNIQLLEAIIEAREDRYKTQAEQLKTAQLNLSPEPTPVLEPVVKFHGFQEAQQLSERISRLEESLIELEKSKSIIDPSISFIIESLNQSDSSDSSRTPSVSQIISDNTSSLSFTMTSIPTLSEGEIITGLYSQGQIIPRKQVIAERDVETNNDTGSSEKTSSGQVSIGLVKDSIQVGDHVERARRIPLPSSEDETESSI
ncbi:hypothetical protein HDV01_002203 [Terramyces sp. JEL0728]|nr:hypothetical protein HDV01_002203 [Terramyces sp. JEL0728]